VKLRRAGVGANFCIHKYFYERSPVWSKVREEATQAMAQVEDDAEEDTAGDHTTPGEQEQPQFDPIDARHLSSLPLLQTRLVSLLKASEDHMCKATNLIMALVGFTKYNFICTTLLIVELGISKPN
jgi:oxalate---CoA ligase